jgi:putative FmdB family regulatory protein
MPVYEYRCERGHSFEVMQRMSDEPLTSCTACSAAVQRVFHPVAVHFKGSGFYTTDYKRKGGGSSESTSATADGAKGESKTDGKSSSAGAPPSGGDPPRSD